jgi:hypothetical protein
MTLAGGYTDVETPSSIPNLEAKRIMADNTLPYWDGNVGRCRLVILLLTSFFVPILLCLFALQSFLLLLLFFILHFVVVCFWWSLE